MQSRGQQLVCKQVGHGRQRETNGDTGWMDRAAQSTRIFVWEPIENLVGQGVDLFRVEGLGVALVLLATRAKCLWGGRKPCTTPHFLVFLVWGIIAFAANKTCDAQKIPRSVVWYIVGAPRCLRRRSQHGFAHQRWSDRLKRCAA